MNRYALRYFNFNYNFTRRNRQEGVILLDAVLCMVLGLLCWAAVVRVYGACLERLQRAADHVHVLGCARRCLQDGRLECERQCVIRRELVRQEGAVWQKVSVAQGKSVVQLLRVQRGA